MIRRLVRWLRRKWSERWRYVRATPDDTFTLEVNETAIDRIVNRPDGEPAMLPCVCGAPPTSLRLSTMFYHTGEGTTFDATITCTACGFALTRLRSSEPAARQAVVERWNAARPLTPPADECIDTPRPERRPDNTEAENG